MSLCRAPVTELNGRDLQDSQLKTRWPIEYIVQGVIMTFIWDFALHFQPPFSHQGSIAVVWHQMAGFYHSEEEREREQIVTLSSSSGGATLSLSRSCGQSQ